MVQMTGNVVSLGSQFYVVRGVIPQLPDRFANQLHIEQLWDSHSDWEVYKDPSLADDDAELIF